MSQYTETGIANATAEALSAAEVRAMPYAGIAALCGVVLGQPGNTSPADFFYVAEAAQIAAALDVISAQAQWDKMELALQAAGLSVAQILLDIGQRPGGEA
jgi:hypothetical protein